MQKQNLIFLETWNHYFYFVIKLLKFYWRLSIGIKIHFTEAYLPRNSTTKKQKKKKLKALCFPW